MYAKVERHQGMGPNLMIVYLSVSWDVFIWLIFEGSKDLSFTAFDIPQSYVFDSVTIELKIKMVSESCCCWPVCVNVGFWLTLSTFDVISSKKLISIAVILL